VIKTNQVPDENTFTDPARLLSILNSVPTIPEKPVEIFDRITHSCHADSKGILVIVKGTAKLKGGRIKRFAITFWESRQSGNGREPPDAEVDFEWLNEGGC